MNNFQPYDRFMRQPLQRALAYSPVVVLTGARQTGKTTLVRDLLGQSRRYLTMDDMDTAERAVREPDALLDTKLPLTLDEVQRTPDLLLAIKRAVDQDRTPGRFLLTGSANLALMRSVSESLAGRAVYQTLMPMTASEARGRGGHGCWDVLLDHPEQCEDAPSPCIDLPSLLLAGGFPPAALEARDDARSLWFEGYVRTYLERDIQTLAAIEYLADFRRFLRLTAMRTGKLMNQSDIARDAGLAQATAHRYFGLLEVSYLLARVPAYAVNATKRMVKSPRLFMVDTGLACHLAGIGTAEQALASDMLGFLAENLVLQDLYAWRETRTPKPEILYWRTTSGKEVDFVIEAGDTLLPVEVKTSRRARLDDAHGLRAFLDDYPGKARHGILVYAGETVDRLTGKIWAVPFSLALGL